MGKISENVIKSWKSTILGLVIVATVTFGLFKYPEVVHWWPQAIPAYVVGALFMLSPDTIIKMSEKLIMKAIGKSQDKSVG